MRKSVTISVIVLCVLLLTSCAPKAESMNINLYYADKDNNKIVLEKREIEVTKEDNIPKIALEELLKGPTSDLNPSIPKDTKLLDIDVEGEKAKVNFSREFSDFKNDVAQKIAVVCVVNTLTDLEGIGQVEIFVDGKELVTSKGEPYGVLEKYDIDKVNAQLDTDIEDLETDDTDIVTLYFPDKEAMYLVPEKREVSKDKPIEYNIVAELIKGPKSQELTPPAIPDEAELLSVEIRDSIAYVNFSKELKEKHIGGSTGEIMAVYPIVNSLTELSKIDKVQFLIEGEKQKSLAGHLSFDEPFSRDESLIEK